MLQGSRKQKLIYMFNKKPSDVKRRLFCKNTYFKFALSKDRSKMFTLLPLFILLLV